MSDRRCPDCDVAMEETRATAEGIANLYAKDERDGGVLKRLGISENVPLTAYGCPECGLVRFYIESD